MIYHELICCRGHTQRLRADLGPGGVEKVLATPLPVLHAGGGGRVPWQLYRESPSNQ